MSGTIQSTKTLSKRSKTMAKTVHQHQTMFKDLKC